MPVHDPHAALLEVHRTHPDILIDLPNFLEVRIWSAIRRHQAVDQEVAVARHPRRTVVAAVRPVGLTLPGFRVQPLVHVVPDEPPLQLIVRLDHVPVILQVADAVPHGVSVLAEDQRPLAGLGYVVQEMRNASVHRGIDVHVRSLDSPLVLDGARRVRLVNPRRRRLEVDAVPALVTERPDDHRRVIAVPLDHPDRAIEVRGLPRRVVSQRDVRVVSHAVRLDVGLVHDVQAVLVGVVVPARVARVVGGPDGVHVVLLHELDVAEHHSFRHHAAGVRIVLVPIHSSQSHGNAVDLEQSVPDLDCPEAHPRGDDLQRVAAVVFEGEEQGVQVRRLGRPLERSGNGALQGDEVRPGRLQSEGRHQRNIEHRASVRAEQFGAQPVGRHRAGQDTPQIHVNCQVAVRVICVEPGAGPEVAHMHARRGHEKHVTLDSADLPVILPFEIRAIREAVDLDGHRVGARLQERRDVELGRRLAPLAVSDLAAVHPQIHGRFHAAEMQKHLHSCPILRHFESLAIRAHGVPVGRHARWIRREGIGDVCVDRDAVAEHLPVRRHRDLVPRGVVEVGAIEISRAIRRIADPVEPPGTAQRPNERRPGRIARQRTFPIRKRMEGGSRRFLVPFEDGGVF